MYLFGEAHRYLSAVEKSMLSDMTPENTLLFSSFVHTLAIQNPAKKYDLMFESIYFLEKPPIDKGAASAVDFNRDMPLTNSTTANAIGLQFVDCIRKEFREKCIYKNLRVHYVDFRRSSHVDNFKHILSDFSNKLLNKSTLLMDDFVENVLKFSLEIVHLPKIKSQFDAIEDVDMRQKLVAYFLERINKITRKHFQARSTPLTSFFDEFSLIFMDIYAFSRILRNFNPEIKKKFHFSFEGTSENVIIYAGDKHIEELVSFFRFDLKLKSESRIFGDSYESFVKINMENF